VPRVVGLDLSIRATGVAWNDCQELAKTDRIVVKGGDARLLEIKNRIVKIAYGATLVVIEDLLNHSHSAGITGMVHGAVRSALISMEVPYAVMPPKSLKKLATGNGNANKSAMALAAFRRGGMEFPDDDQCDAWWLWVAGMCHLDNPPFQLPATQWDQLKNLRVEVL
jgi:Holliday junction resolvasome RuvABC endonuclease subunit